MPNSMVEPMQFVGEVRHDGIWELVRHGRYILTDRHEGIRCPSGSVRRVGNGSGYRPHNRWPLAITLRPPIGQISRVIVNPTSGPGSEDARRSHLDLEGRLNRPHRAKY